MHVVLRAQSAIIHHHHLHCPSMQVWHDLMRRVRGAFFRFAGMECLGHARIDWYLGVLSEETGVSDKTLEFAAAHIHYIPR
jgi:hypothetical protein